MSSINFNPWLEYRVAPHVRKLRTYVQLPTFSYSPTWEGVSQLITQFNFSANKNFWLLNRPNRPSGVNFILCIKYRVGDTVFRYKLWGGGVALDQVPLYTNQIIKKNFILEVWSEASGDVELDEALNIITSVNQVPSDITDLDDVALATGVEFNDYALSSVAATPLPSTPILHYTPDSIVGNVLDPCTTWENVGSLAGGDLTSVSPGTIFQDLNGYKFLSLPDSAARSYTVGGLSFNAASIWLVMALNTKTAGNILVEFSDFPNSFLRMMTGVDGLKGRFSTPGPIHDDTAENIEFTTGLVDNEVAWFVVNLRFDDTEVAISIGSSPYNIKTITGAISIPLTDFTILNSGGVDLKITEVAVFNTSQGGITPDGQGNLTLNTWWNYFMSKFSPGLAFPLGFQAPLNYNSGTAWLDND